MVAIPREAITVNAPLPLLHLAVVAAVADTVACEHQLCWQICNARNLLDASKLMYQGPFIVLKWKYFSVQLLPTDFSVATNLDKELEASVFERGRKKLKISDARY